MTATAASSPLRAAVAEALAEVLDDHSAASVARELGHATSTVTRRGPDLGAWPVADLLILVPLHTQLRRRLLDALHPSHDPLPMSAETNARALVRSWAREIERIMAALEDGRLDPLEARAIERDLCAIERQVADCRADLRAKARQ